MQSASPGVRAAGIAKPLMMRRRSACRWESKVNDRAERGRLIQAFLGRKTVLWLSKNPELPAFAWNVSGILLASPPCLK